MASEGTEYLSVVRLKYMGCLTDVVVRDAALEGVPSALTAARDGIDALVRDRGLRRTAPELTTESLLRGAVASARVEGSAATLAEVRAGRGDAISTGAARLNSQLLSLVPVVRRAPLQALARMHALAASPSSPETSGRPRDVPGLAPRLHALAALLTGPVAAPALAVAGTAHAEVAVLAPFDSANGVVARALERLLLVVSGVDPTSLTVPEVGHHKAGAVYREALAAYSTGSVAGRRRWLLHTAEAVTAGVTASPLVS
jgi:hypothetical protein